MNSPYRDSGGGVGWIILLVLLYIIFNLIPGPIDDAGWINTALFAKSAEWFDPLHVVW